MFELHKKLKTGIKLLTLIINNIRNNKLRYVSVAIWGIWWGLLETVGSSKRLSLFFPGGIDGGGGS